jgi:hypothetical protein
MRLARVRAKAIPQLRAALTANEISLYRAGEIAKLPADRQAMVVTQWRDRSLLRTEGQAIAVQVIRGFLNDSVDKENPINLAELSAAIRDTIRGSLIG